MCENPSGKASVWIEFVYNLEPFPGEWLQIIDLVYFHFVLPTVQLFVDECNKGMVFLQFE